MTSHGKAGKTKPDPTWTGVAWDREARQPRLAWEWQGTVRRDTAAVIRPGKARHDSASQGKAGRTTRGLIWRGVSSQGPTGRAWSGQTRRGLEWLGLAGKTRHGSTGRAVARRGRQDWTGQGKTSLGVAGPATADKTSRAAAHLRRARDLAVALGYADDIDRLIADVTALDRQIQMAILTEFLVSLPDQATRETSYNGVSPDLVPLYKATVGDPSDSIIGIPGFGDKTWSDVDKDHLIQFFKRLEAGENPPAETVFGLPKRCINWMNENHDTMRAVWKIVHFFQVPDHLMKKHSVMGTPDPAKVDTLLREFWL